MRTLCISQKMRQPCLIIMRCYYFDCRINKLFTLSSYLICVSYSVHLISAYYVRKGSWAFFKSQLPTNQQGQKIQSRHRRFEWSSLGVTSDYFVSHFGLFRYGHFRIRFLVLSPTCFAPLSHVVKGKQGSTETFPKIEVHPCGFWEMLLIESSFAFLARNLESKTQIFP